MSDSKKQMPMKDDGELRTFEDLLEEQEQLMQDVRYDAFKQEYYGAFITNMDNMINSSNEIPQKLDKPDISVEISININSKFDSQILEQQIELMVADKLDKKPDGKGWIF